MRSRLFGMLPCPTLRSGQAGCCAIATGKNHLANTKSEYYFKRMSDLSLQWRGRHLHQDDCRPHALYKGSGQASRKSTGLANVENFGGA